MYHSLTIGDKNTYDDWKLVPNEFPRFTPPAAKTYSVSIPGADGSLDLTYALTGDVKFENREGQLTFYYYSESGEPFYDYYYDLINYLHGQTFKCVLEDDPAYYWVGRFALNEWASNPPAYVVINYVMEPYKYEDLERSYKWVWDPTDFTKDLCRDYCAEEGWRTVVNGITPLVVCGGRKKISPTINAIVAPGDELAVTFGNKKYRLENGANIFQDLTLALGNNRLIFSGIGEVSVYYQGGML